MKDFLEIAKKEEEFLEDWGKDIPGFTKDGIVNPEEYINAPLKILILLKEVNGEVHDLRKFLREQGGRAQTWDNVARWVEGILNLDKDYAWKDLEQNNEIRRKKMLNKICAVNVKKTPGGHTADGKNIKKTAKENAEKLKEQINLYSPDLIICGGTDYCYFGGISSEQHIKWEMTSRGIWYVRENSGRIIVSYSHPEARVKNSILYYGLLDAIKEIYK